MSAPLLGRCKEKGCDHALFLGSDSDAIDVDNFREVKAGTRAYRVGNNGFFSRCPNSHKFFPLKRIEGTFSKDHKCDARCLNAKGHKCTCSCGGANHGRGYAVEVHDAINPCAEIVTDTLTDKQADFMRSLLNEREIPDSVGRAGNERREVALKMLDVKGFTKAQASATIKWLLELPKKEQAWTSHDH